MKEKTREQHVLMGAVVDVVDGATPVGWPEYEPFTEDVPKHRQVTAVYESEQLAPFGSFEVAGWNWDPRDLVIG